MEAYQGRPLAEEYAAVDCSEDEKGWRGGVAHVDDVEEIIKARILASPRLSFALLQHGL